jgi:hypothetical protein
MEARFTFCNREWLLLHQCLNEVLNGFRLDDLEAVIGMKEEALVDFLRYLAALPAKAEISLDLLQTSAFRNALRETLRELGIEEFHTRTGYDFDEGKAILAKLDAWCRSSADNPGNP